MRSALIGAGKIARQHLACLDQLPGVEVVAVCDRSPAAAEAAAQRFKIPTWYTAHEVMLREARPDVVHVTTPATSHFRLAMDVLEAGAHVFVEKPATETLDQLEQLAERAKAGGLELVENHNYLFNRQVREIIRRVNSGEFGAVTHVEVMICLDILAPGGAYSDRNAPHPSLSVAGGAISEFLTHLASLAYLFVGPHLAVHAIWSNRSDSMLPYDEFRALVDARHGTATLAFSANTKPDAFWLRVYGEREQAVANLFETRLTVDRRRAGPKPLSPVLNGLCESRDVGRAAMTTLWRKLSGGPGTYEGLWELLGQTYRALTERSELPIPLHQVLEVNQLLTALKPRPQSEVSS